MIGRPVERCASSLSVTALTPPSTNPALAMDSAACALHIRKPSANRETLNAQQRRAHCGLFLHSGR
jgi:hypothetical protein